MKTRPIVLITLAAIVAACQPSPAPTPAATSAPAEGEKLKFAVMTFSHETCTFCPGGDTTVEDWTRLGEPYVGDEVFDSGAGYAEGDSIRVTFKSVSTNMNILASRARRTISSASSRCRSTGKSLFISNSTS